MPSLRDTIDNSVKLSNYVPVPVPSAPPVIATQPAPAPENANMRFILPPFNTDPDSVRLFEGSAPKIRIWPRPQQKAGAAALTTTATGHVTSTSSASAGASSSSSSSSSSTGNLTVQVATGLLVTGFQGSLTMSKSFQLISLTVSRPCEVRIYGTALAQAQDAYRPTGAPVPPEITSNIISCVTFDTAPYVWPWQNRCGANQSSPQTTTIYVSVINTDPTIQTPVTVTIVYLPLETA